YQPFLDREYRSHFQKTQQGILAGQRGNGVLPCRGLVPPWTEISVPVCTSLSWIPPPLYPRGDAHRWMVRDLQDHRTKNQEDLNPHDCHSLQPSRNGLKPPWVASGRIDSG